MLVDVDVVAPKKGLFDYHVINAQVLVFFDELAESTFLDEELLYAVHLLGCLWTNMRKFYDFAVF